MITTRQYQEDGIAWLLRKKRGILADAPGLGKTFQSLETIDRAGAYPALIFCPAHLVEQWATFIKTQYPNRKVSYSRKADFYLRDWALTKKADFYVANIEMLRKTGFYAWPSVRALIFDESHHLKNRNSKQSIGALKMVLGLKPEYVICLSATPIKREADDLFGQIRLLKPQIFTSYNTFVKAFCEAEETPWGSRVLGVKDSVGLVKLLEALMLRREYHDVNMQLPELIECILPVEFSPAQRKAYETLKHELVLRVDGNDEEIPYMWYIQALQTLRRMTACSEKIQTCVDLALDSNRAVVFTKYRRTADLIAEKLEVSAINGDVPPLERNALAQSTQHTVATMDSLTEGVDLSMFDTVIFAEEDYTPGTNYQALSRVRRFGANPDEPILRYCVHVEDSIDEVVHAMSTRRDISAKEILLGVLNLAPRQIAEITA